MKKISFALFFCLFILLHFVTYVSADMGPKPSSLFVISGLPDQNIYFDLFVKAPDTILTLSESDWAEIDEADYYTFFPRNMEGYIDEDGYASFTLYTTLPHALNNLGLDELGYAQYKTGYLICPTTFKIVFYTTDGYIISSNIIEKEYFQATFTLDVSGISFDFSHSFDVTPLENGIDYSFDSITPLIVENNDSQTVLPSFIDFLFRFTLTLSIEIILLYFFQYEKIATYLLVISANLVTQSMITLCFFYFYDRLFPALNYLSQLLLYEILVLMIEMLIYYFGFKEFTRRRAIYYALLANFITLIFTFLIPII
ncbi:MAG: hypothetical protein AB7U79_08075 [Candidatus Izemoplasmatales bacterium]